MYNSRAVTKGIYTGFAVLLFLLGFLLNKLQILEQQENKTSYVAYEGYQVSSPTPTEIVLTPTPQVEGNKFIPTPTQDPDPIITCKSKTGDLKVRQSVCSAYTDCPDGSGGYVFESQESCQKRWESLSKELNDAVAQWGDAYLENLKLQQELNMLNAQNEGEQILNEAQQKTDEILNNLSGGDYSTDPLPQIKESNPTPETNYEGTIVY